ncbi:MAG: sortase [Candidatus Nomurabacteria bacterium]|nr:MAG: sortase [Candidatus Nomurabacteria bacterium]
MPSDTKASGELKQTKQSSKAMPQIGWSQRRLRTVRILAIVLILIGIGVILYPFFPAIRYELFHPEPAYPYSTKLQETNVEENGGHLPDVADTLPSESRLVIPKIGVNMQIVEGENESALFRGSWRLPQTSTPEKGGNTVLTVHRFQYLAGPNTLALADRLEAGDIVIVYWKGQDGQVKEYDYQISKTYLVDPHQVEILDNTEEPKLTLFTCAPMFSTKQRLVIDGALIEN